LAGAVEAEKVAPQREAETSGAEQKLSTVNLAEKSDAEEVAAATFADAVGRDAESATEQQAESVSVSVTADTVAAEESQIFSSDAGGEDMGDVKSKSGKSNWHQIRTAPAGAAANSDMVEAAKQGAEETPKAMAAAAAADGSASASTLTPDASTIASIVDSVMADLRPKIVEEIAKKLAGK
jgi:hypothetical protein